MIALLAMEEPRTRIAAMMCGLDIHYELGGDHPLLGRRIPDLDLHTGAGTVRLFSLLHPARTVLLNLTAPRRFADNQWQDRISIVDASCNARWRLPVIGDVPAPKAVLVRPDGYVAWVSSDGTDTGLAQALIAWAGPAARLPGVSNGEFV
jgi:3-(3-hydroxy-phenyl)propionate hydroxylase